MRILLIHMSDFHIKEDDELISNIKIEQMCSILDRFKDASKVMLLFTGDVAFSGGKEQYEKAAEVFKRIKCGLEEWHGDNVPMYCVPGNHDIANLKDYPCLKDKGSFDRDWRIYFEMQDLELENYRAFSALFDGSIPEGGTVSLVEESAGNGSDQQSVAVCLINTAPLSFLGTNDKGQHYIGEDSLAKIRAAKEHNLRIALMHHSPEWFGEACILPLKNALGDAMDIVFIGHEHRNETFSVSPLGGPGFMLSKVGQSKFGIGGGFCFSALCFDFLARKYEKEEYRWNPNALCFNLVSSTPGSFPGSDGRLLRLCSEFEEKFRSKDRTLNYSEGLGDSFVFPLLSGVDSSSPKKKIQIDSFDDYFEKTKQISVIEISGDGGSGKSTLLNRLFWEYLKRKYCPLVISGDIPSGQLDRKIERLAEHQYGADSIDKYKAISKSRKVLVIDAKGDSGWRGIRANKEALLGFFGKVVISSSTSYNPSTFDEDLPEIAQLGFSGLGYASLSIEPLYHSKRVQFVENICRLRELGSMESQSVVDAVNLVAREHRYMVELKPDYILAYTEYFIRKGVFSSASDYLPLIEIYRDNIRNKLTRACRKVGVAYPTESLIDQYLSILEQVAIGIHSKREPMADYSEIVDVVNRLNYERALNNRPGVFLNVCESSGLLFKDPETAKYCFENTNVLAFFVAEFLESREADGSYIVGLLRGLIHDLPLGIAERVVLLLSKRKNSQEWVSALKDELSELDDVPSFVLGGSSISYLKGAHASDVKFGASNSEGGSRFANELEKGLPFEDKLAYRDAYRQGDPEGVDVSLLKYMKCLELLGRSFSSRFAISSFEEKEWERRMFYTIPRKVIERTLSSVDEGIDEKIRTIVKSLSEDEMVKKVPSQEEVAQFVVDFSYLFVCSIFDRVAYCFSTPDTVEYIGKYEGDDATSAIQRMFAESRGLFDEEFVDRFCKVLGKGGRAVGALEKHLYMLCANIYMQRNPHLDHRLIQRIGAALGDGRAERRAILGRGEAIWRPGDSR